MSRKNGKAKTNMAQKVSRVTRSNPAAATAQPPPPVPQPAPRHEQQLAVFGSLVLDIEQAHHLLRAAPRRTVRIDVSAWARLYGLDGDPHSPITVGPTFNPLHTLAADLTRPLIMITLVDSGGRDAVLIADGSHRLARAFLEGFDHLPAHVLTAAETEAITLTRPEWKDHTGP